MNTLTYEDVEFEGDAISVLFIMCVCVCVLIFADRIGEFLVQINSVPFFGISGAPSSFRDSK